MSFLHVVSRFSVLLALAAGPVAAADSYPSRPLRLVVPFAAGGAVDAVARTVAARLSEDLGQKVIVENRAGASGNIGAEAVVRSPADGYTLLLTASTLVVNPLIMKDKPPFDPARDLTHLALVASGPLLFVTPPSTGVTSVREFVAKAKAAPEKFNFAVGGFGAAGHLAVESFKYRAGLAVPTILYKGTAPALVDLMGGQVSGMMDPLLSSLPPVKANKLTALAITGQRRSPLAPDVPTFTEAGYPEVNFSTWYGLWAPANLPAPVAARLETAVKRMVTEPQVREWFERQGLEPAGVTGASFRAFIDQETAKSHEIVKLANIAEQ
ncbi:MAG: tripartite tricarboxylate transporter substrate binding protein [Pigmentiphaga sp.]|uniref:Bug family tripartite tricarboxylate transporter substrate binding protein n=1 Tax=Pigmentiphaga sp. TaxID=1977564 RepID=UPI0029B1F4F9|nr:tripartite tricarboxylate transporter substrate binding protein [Pigmentiphaga sp.]MDX3904628.1 tripartite tricarboxylate transporter substrate binding protein [Pigmentiphaga sp.]